MGIYIASINRKKYHVKEETLQDYYKNITLGRIDAPNIDKAFKTAQKIFQDHPDRLLVHVVLSKKASPTQQKVAEQKHIYSCC